MRPIVSQGRWTPTTRWLPRSLLMVWLVFLCNLVGHAAPVQLKPPANAVALLPVLKKEQQAYWATLQTVSYLGAQVEQETCPSLTSKSCWSTSAQLLTPREQGVGLGQLTRAFKSDGTLRFDAMQELVDKHPKELKGLNWNTWKDPELQLRAVVLKNQDTFRLIKGAASEKDALAMAASAYNSGAKNLSNSRLACRAKAGCNPNVWFGQVELANAASKTIIPGYGGQSPWSINTTYVKNVMIVRRVRYTSLDAKP